MGDIRLCGVCGLPTITERAETYCGQCRQLLCVGCCEYHECRHDAPVWAAPIDLDDLEAKQQRRIEMPTTEQQHSPLICGYCGYALPASIAQAVIAHEKLVAALKSTRELIRQGVYDGYDDRIRSLMAALQTIENALEVQNAN